MALEKRLSRTKATLVGAGAGMAAELTIAIAFMTLAAGSSAAFQRQGLTGASFIALALPGSLFIAAMFALPTSAAMVFSVSALSKKWTMFDTAAAWMGGGVLFSSPTAYLLSDLQGGSHRFALISIWSLVLLIGACVGLFAWLFRHVTVETRAAQSTPIT